MTNKNNSSNRGEIRRRTVAPIVQRRLNEEAGQASTNKIDPKAAFRKFFTRSELETLGDPELLATLLNTPHARVHLDALGVALARPSLQSNAVIKVHAERHREAQKVVLAMKEKARAMEFAAQSEGKRWFRVGIGSWKGVLFATRQSVIGAAYSRYKQECSDEKLRMDRENKIENSVSVDELRHNELMN